MNSFSAKTAGSVSGSNFSLSTNVDEFCQILLITCLRSTGPHFGRFVQKALERKFPGRLASGEEAWRRRCTSFLPLSVRKHAKLGNDGEWKDVYAILEVTRAYLRSVFLPLSENVVSVSKFEQLEQLNKEVNAVQQCRNWVCHLQPVSVAELTSCLHLFKRLVNRFKPGTNGEGIRKDIAVEIDHNLTILGWAKKELNKSSKRTSRSAPKVESGARTTLKVQSNLSLRPPDKSDHLKIADTEFQSLQFADSNVGSAFLKMRPPEKCELRTPKVGPKRRFNLQKATTCVKLQRKTLF